MDKPLDSVGFNMLIVAAKIIRDHGELICRVGSDGEFQVLAEDFKKFADLTSAEIELTSRASAESPWKAAFTVDGVRFMAVLSTAELPLVGYEIPGYVPSATVSVPVRISTSREVTF